MSEAKAFLNNVFHQGQNGFLALVMRRLHDGKMLPVFLDWPGDADRVDTDLEPQLGDIYVCPALRSDRTRRKGGAIGPGAVWVDLDGEPADLELWQRLDPTTVDSGTPGHMHGYVRLTEPLADLHLHAQLGKALAGRFKTDPKWSDESLLRLPGTLNHKQRPPRGVALTYLSSTTWDVAELVELLSPLPDVVTGSALPDLSAAVTVDVAGLPVPLQRLVTMRDSPQSRSEHLYRLVAEAHDAGLEVEQVYGLCLASPIINNAEAQERYGSDLEHLREDIARVWDKLSGWMDGPAARLQSAAGSDRGGQHSAGPWAALGTAPFDPQTRLSLPLARDVLRRALPVLRYAVDTETWLLRQGSGWEARPRADRAVLSVLADLMPQGSGQAAEGTVERRRFEAWKYMHGGPAGVSAVTERMRDECARGDHPATAREAQLDLAATVLWAGGTAYDLTRSAERPVPLDVQPDEPYLRSTPITPANVPTPAWDHYCETMWPNQEIRRWVMRTMGPAVTGYPMMLPILVGPRGRGKTQFVTIISAALGSYASMIDPKVLRGDAHGAFVLKLRGLRLAYVDEGPRDTRSGQEHLKYITGGGQLIGNRMHGNPIAFTPTHTLVLSSNDMPDLHDEALQRRVALIPCEASERAVAQARADLTPHLATELPGILASLMREAAGWLADRDSATQQRAPGDHANRVLEVAAEQDPIMRWVRDRCEPVPAELGESASLLYRDFVDWCRQSNVAPIPKIQKWGRDLSEMGYERFLRGGAADRERCRPLRRRHGQHW